MRILHVISSLNPAGGGPCEVVRQFGNAMNEDGLESHVVCADDFDSKWIGDYKFPVHSLGKQRDGYGYHPKWVPWLKKEAPVYDAVISHGLWQYHGRAVWQALRGTSIPYFVYPHGMLDPWFKKAYPLKHLKKAIYWKLFESKILRDARAVIFTCEEERRLAQNTFRPYRCSEKIVYLGIEPPAGNAEAQKAAFFAEFSHYRGKRLLLFIGRLHDKKGCDLLIRAFGKLLGSQPSTLNSQPHLVMAGPPSSDVYLVELQKLAINCCPLGSVSFPGMLSGDLKWGAFHASEAFVLPSHQENFGIAVVEAIACGLPVLISNRVNIWKEILDGGAGLVEADTLLGTEQMLKVFFKNQVCIDGSYAENARKLFNNYFHIRRASDELGATIKF
jgi:glycosyltransferase involved in cell wall biosynthesis